MAITNSISLRTPIKKTRRVKPVVTAMTAFASTKSLKERRGPHEATHKKVELQQGQLLSDTPVYSQEEAIASVSRVLVGASGSAYELVDSISSALHGEIYQGWSLSMCGSHLVRLSQKVAVKSFRRSALTSRFNHENVLKELAILQSLEWIGRFPIVLDCICDEQMIYLVMQFVEGVELFHILSDKGSFSLDEAAQIMKSLLTSLLQLESAQIVHRDVSLENVLIDEHSLNATLIDFGVALNLSSTSDAEHCAKQNYRPPESFVAETKIISNNAGDVWACGIIFLSLLLGFLPFEEATSHDERFEYLRTGRLAILLESWGLFLPSSALHFALAMLDIEASSRASISALLKHPFLDASSHLEEEEQLFCWDSSFKSYSVDGSIYSPSVASSVSSSDFESSMDTVEFGVDDNGQCEYEYVSVDNGSVCLW